MDSITAKKEYCSDKCRIYAYRERKKKTAPAAPVATPELLGVLHTENGMVIINPDTGAILQSPKPPVKTKINLDERKKQYPRDEDSPDIVPPVPVKLPGEDPLIFAGRKNDWKRKFL